MDRIGYFMPDSEVDDWGKYVLAPEEEDEYHGLLVDTQKKAELENAPYFQEEKEEGLDFPEERPFGRGHGKQGPNKSPNLKDGIGRGRGRWAGNRPLQYKDFIPPIPKIKCLQFIPPQIDPRTPQEIELQIKEKWKNTKFYNDPPIPFVKIPFWAKFLGIVDKSLVLIQIKDPIVEKQYATMKDDLQKYYKNDMMIGDVMKRVMPFEEIDVGRIVVAVWERDNEKTDFARGRVIKIDNENQKVAVRCLDTGDTKLILGADIFYTIPLFMEYPVRLQRCKLKNLKFWYGSNVLTECCVLLPALHDNGTVVECEVDADDGISVIDLEVTKKATKANRDLETMTLSQLFFDVIKGFTRVPRNFVCGYMFSGGHVGIVEEDGKVWIKMHSKLSYKLSSMGENPKLILTSEQFNPPVENQPRLSDFEFAYHIRKQRIFLARFFDDRVFYRVKILQLENQNKAKVQYMDFGNIEVIPIEDIMPIDFVEPILAKIPIQVFPGYLNGIDKILDIDQFFEVMSINVLQKILVAGFKSPEVPLLDVYAHLNKDDQEVTYLNNLLLEKGIAKGKYVEKPVKPFDLTPTRVSVLKNVSTTLQPNKYTLNGFNRRFYASCRIISED